MGNKKNTNFKFSGKTRNILPINVEVQSYQDAFDIYRQYPCLPALFALMDKALEVGARFQEIENELDLLTNIELDQFYGAYGSKYFNKNHEELASLSAYRPHSTNASSVSQLLWRFLGHISGEDLYIYQNYLVGVADYCYLKDKEDVLEINLDKVSTDNSKDKAISKISELAYRQAIEYDQNAKNARYQSEEAVKSGFSMVPWASWISPLISNRPLLKESLSDFSEYLSSYYVNSEEIDLSDFGFTSNPKTMHQENRISIAKIAAFCIFAPLFKKKIYVDVKFEITSFWSERIDYLSSIDSLVDVNDQAEYLVAISNLLMVCAKVDVGSVTNGIVSDDELERSYLSEVYADCLVLTCLAPLPSFGYGQMLVKINSFENVCRDEIYSLSYGLRVSNYGLTGSPDPYYLDEMFNYAFQGIDLELTGEIRKQIEQSVKQWVIPFGCIEHLQYLYTDFWSDKEILAKISESLVESDKNKSIGCLFTLEELSEMTGLADCLSEDFHPAMFIRTFSNKVDFWNFSDSDWIKFGQSLYQAGQTRYASTLLALYLNICGIKKHYYPEASISIDIPAISKLLGQLSCYDSFSMIRQAIADLFEIYENLPAIYRGSLQEYLPLPKAALTLLKIKQKDEDRFVRYRNILIEEGFRLARLAILSQDWLVMGYTYSRDPDLLNLKLSSSAMNCYFQAIESELKSRILELDKDLANELREYKGIDIVWKSPENKSYGQRSGYSFKGLGAIHLMLENFSSFSFDSQAKLSGFNKLVNHSDIELFLSSICEFTKIRNPLQHGDIPNIHTDKVANKLLARIEELLFGDGCIVQVLCDSR